MNDIACMPHPMVHPMKVIFIVSKLLRLVQAEGMLFPRAKMKVSNLL